MCCLKIGVLMNRLSEQEGRSSTLLTHDDKSLRYVNSLFVRSFCKNDCHAYLFVFVALVTDFSEFVPGFFACISLSF